MGNDEWLLDGLGPVEIVHIFLYWCGYFFEPIHCNLVSPALLTDKLRCVALGMCKCIMMTQRDVELFCRGTCVSRLSFAYIPRAYSGKSAH